MAASPIIRSVLVTANTDDPELILRNASAVRENGYDFNLAEDGVIWEWVQDFISRYRHAPKMASVREHFMAVRQELVVDRLDTISATPPRYRGDFIQQLDAELNDRRQLATGNLLSDAARILSQGLTVKVGREEKTLVGAVDAVQYVMDRAPDIVIPRGGSALSGCANADGDSVIAEYDRKAQDPLAGLGQLSGLPQMDVVLNGLQRGELWTHAAFTGGLKSTLAINWLYNQAVYYRHSSIMFSLEMPYDQVRRILYCIHSNHPKFQKVRQQLGVAHSIEYDKLKVGKLVPAEEKFFKEHVVPDFNDPSNNYGGIYIEVADPSKSDYTVVDMKNRAELLHQKDPSIKMIVCDHAGLMQSRGRHPSTTERLNEVLRDLKRLALSFNRGEGIGVIALFQISREGFKAAEKNGGRYNLTHLSYANEAERSSDVVTAGWVDEQLRESSLVKFMHLKSRDTALFQEFYAGVLWKCRRIFAQTAMTPGDAKQAGDSVDLGL